MVAKSAPRYKGPVTDKNFEDIDNSMEQQAFIFEAQERAEGIARTFGRKYSFMRRVAIELFGIADREMGNGS